MADIEREPIDRKSPCAVIGGESVELTPENTRCVIHAVGKVAIGDIVRNSSDFDHIRILIRHEDSPEGRVAVSVYLFRGAVNDMLFDYEGFGQAITTLEEVGIPMQINTPSVSSNAINKFFDRIESSSHFESSNIDEDLNDLIDQYRRDNGDEPKD